MYVEGFVLAVPTAKKEEFRKHVEDSVPFFKKLGATRQVECWGDDIRDGKVTDFKRAVRAGEDETVVFSWLEYPDKATRDAATETMTNDPSATSGMSDMPFDGKRLIFSGFMPILQEGSDKGAGYIDGFVIPVDQAKQDAYLEVAKWSAPIFMEHGTSGVIECWGDDVKRGELTDFYRAVDAKEGENIVFSWMSYPSREARDKAQEATMADERFGDGSPEMPFDGKRLIMGGFIPLVDQ